MFKLCLSENNMSATDQNSPVNDSAKTKQSPVDSNSESTTHFGYKTIEKEDKISMCLEYWDKGLDL